MTTLTARAPAPARPAPEAGRRRQRRRGRLLHVYTWLVILWLMTPIFVIIAFGFNDTKGKFNYEWQGFTLNWYRHLFDINDLTSALINSITIALIVTALATAMGTLIGFALGRWRFRGQGATELTLFANISAPEITLGTALLSLFVTANIPRGYWTIVIAQVMFDIAYVAVTVRARMAGFDVRLEEAARDLGAGIAQTLRRVTIRIVFVAILGAALLAFAFSFDEVLITNFTSGTTTTLPIYIYSKMHREIDPSINAVATLLLVTPWLALAVAWPLLLGRMSLRGRSARPR
jgi:spermidine/putrescine transport system permease protein